MCTQQKVHFTLFRSTLAQEMENEDLLRIDPAFTIPEGGTIYDFCWYPLMRSQAPETCFFLSSSARRPVHMWDAFTGNLKASYTCLNNVHETANVYSVAFDTTGTKFALLVCLFVLEYFVDWIRKFTFLIQHYRAKACHA